MKKSLKRVLSSVLAATMLVGTGAFVNEPAPAFTAAEAYAASSYITESAGWFESAYVEWTAVPNATGYAAYVKGASEADSAYTMLDNELVRKYPTYYRADAVGLKAGQYVMKIVPYVNGSADESLAFTTDTLTVNAYDRSGAAFSSKSTFKTGSGAYNDDGTLRSDAIVVYATNETAKTVTATIGGVSYTGLQNIIYGKQKKGITTPVDIRIIGTIEAENMDSFGSSAEGIQVKGAANYSEMNITIEGIGEDAGVKGFGFLVRNCGNIEFRNFAIMACMDDSISMDTANCNVWIHNMDLFYGSTGGDADQAKGDGTLDLKGKSTYITMSYNHFWDSGKSSLCGMKSETAGCQVTYHHNWFDHSDSRHPRIRTITVHAYNNYFDGNSKYGVGVTMGSSAFVESNYFRNTKHPMMSSMQGSDIMENEKTGVADFSGDGTFSGETGGVIKAYNNHVEGSDADKFSGGVEPVYYNAADTQTNGAATQYDAYQASSRSEQVPSSVKSLSGGNTYNNFDTDTSNWDLAVDPADITPVEDVPAVVTANAGRMSGGDFPEDRTQFTILNDDTSYAVDTEFKSAMLNYTTSLVSVGGLDAGSLPETTTNSDVTTETTTKNTEGSTETTTKTVESSTEATTVAPPVIDPSGAASMGTYKFDGTTGTFNVTENGTYGNIAFNFRSYESNGVKLRAGNTTTFKLAAETKVTITYISGPGVVITDGTTTYTFDDTTDTNTLPAGSYTLKGASDSNSMIGSMTLTATGSTPVDPTPTELTGDANGDGTVDRADMTMVLDFASGKISAVTKSDLADVSGDGKVSAYDAYLIGKIILG